MIANFENKAPQLGKEVFIAEGAHVIGDVHIGAGSSIWFNSVVRGDVHFIRIGERTNIQDNSVVHVTGGVHPTVVGNEVTVGHRVILHGCTIEDRALIGMGAVVMDGAVIGRETIIGAGAVVTPGTKIPPRVLALGSPCKVVRELNKEEIQFLEGSALHYYELAKKYLKNKLL
jgi:carbonic anhydrase/acetyltransferase-like protein (isoleucine patch superfamily)